MNTSLEMAKLAINALDDKKGEDIKIIDTDDLRNYLRNYY